jgi:hypothetical protein
MLCSELLSQFNVDGHFLGKMRPSEVPKEMLAIFCALGVSCCSCNRILSKCIGRRTARVMNIVSGWFEKDLLETFYLIVEAYKNGSIDEQTFFDRIYTIAERYGRHAGKEEASPNQMTLFST